MLVLTEIVFKCSSNDNDSPRIVPKCFWEEVLSQFNSFAETSTLKTTENSEVSSAKSFALDDKSFINSLT